MAKNSADYWRDREAAQRKKDIVDQMAYNREIRRIYQSTLDNVQKEIDAFYGRYAEKEGITLAEAKRRVSRIDMEAYERKAKRYVRERDFSPQANEEMRLYNLTMKVNRLEMLKANIGLELVRGFDDLNRTFDEKLTRHATGEFERLAGILGDSVRNNEELAHAIVNASFHNATYSDRIWAYQDLLRDEIGKQVQTGLLQGRNSMELARAVQKRFDVSRSDAERLMMTEMRRVRTEVAKQSYEQNGNTEYQFLALGGNPCNDCADLDGRVFPVKEMMPGVNAPPMHPRCLCSTAPYWDEAKFQEWLDSGAAADGVPWAEFEEQNPVAKSIEAGINDSAIQYNLSRLSEEHQREVQGALEQLNAEYENGLQRVIDDAKTFGGNKERSRVEFGDGSMHLEATGKLDIVFHEFAHFIVSKLAEKQGYASYDPKFWKEMRKLHKEYKEQIHRFGNRHFALDPMSYADNIDEFIAEAFSAAKLPRVGANAQIEDKTYAHRALEIIDRYFRKDSVAKPEDSGIIKHKGMLIDIQFFANKGIPKQTDRELERSIKSWQKRVEEHKSKIADPASYDKKWFLKSERHRAGLLRHWEKEIKTFEENISQAKDELEKRGEQK